MNRTHIAGELLKAAKEMTAGDDIFKALQMAEFLTNEIRMNGELSRPDVRNISRYHAMMKNALKDYARNRSGKSMTADGRDDFYFKRLEEALQAIQHVPIYRGWDNKQMQLVMKQKQKEIADGIEEMIDKYPIDTDYMVVGLDGGTLRYKSEEDLITAMKRLGFRHTGHSSSGRLKKVLWDQPTFDGLIGPMADRAKTVRYETAEANRVLSM